MEIACLTRTRGPKTRKVQTVNNPKHFLDEQIQKRGKKTMNHNHGTSRKPHLKQRFEQGELSDVE